jgi:pimeloyl-ACP methyl ester carboxylesterase
MTRLAVRQVARTQKLREACRGRDAQHRFDDNRIQLCGQQPALASGDLAAYRLSPGIEGAPGHISRECHSHAIPKSQLAIFPGATHMIPAQDPARFNGTVLDFFDKPFAMPDTKDLGWFD